MGNKGKRILYLDMVKGIGILLVVLGHIIPMERGIGKYLYSFHMPMFFMISGILLFEKKSWENEKLFNIILGKLRQIMYPYLIISFVSLVIIRKIDGLTKFVKNLYLTLMLEGISALWFLPTLFFAELIFVLVIRYIKKPVIREVLVVLCILLMWMFSNYSGHNTSSYGFLL